MKITVNGQSHPINTDADRPLLEVLREDLKLTGTRYGCGEGQCGACTVLVDGGPTRSCLTPISAVADKSVTTIEGIADEGTLHPVQQTFLKHNAFQCGYCTSGMIVELVGVITNNREISDADLMQQMNGHLCRCCGYNKIGPACLAAKAAMKGGAR